MLKLQHLTKQFGAAPLFTDLCMEVDAPVVLWAPSGWGKTTLLRILMGLEQPDEGTIETDMDQVPGDGLGRNSLSSLTVSAVFQEDRLCESFSPVENVTMCTGRSMKASRVRWEMARLLPEECLSRPVSTLSGGMKRRVAVLRALLTPSHILLMDEPFTGMDEDLKRSVIAYIKEKQDGRILILSTHQEEDVELMGGELVRLKQEQCR